MRVEELGKQAAELWVIWSDSKFAKSVRNFVGYIIFFNVIGFGWVYGWAYISNEIVRIHPDLWWVIWVWIIGYILAMGIIFIEIPLYFRNRAFWKELDARNAKAYKELKEYCAQPDPPKAKKRKKKT